MSFADALPEPIRDEIAASLTEASRAPKEEEGQESSSSEFEKEEGAATSSSSFDFAQLIAPLEERSGLRLNGPGLDWCRAAAAENPEGFARCVQTAREGRQPLHLLCSLVRKGEHRRQVEPLARRSLARRYTGGEILDQLRAYTQA